MENDVIVQLHQLPPLCHTKLTVLVMECNRGEIKSCDLSVIRVISCYSLEEHPVRLKQMLHVAIISDRVIPVEVAGLNGIG